MKKKFDSQPITEEVLDQKLEKALQQVVQDISDLQNSKWEEANAKFEKLFIGQDRMMKILVNWEVENTVDTEQIRELRVNVDDHSKRIKSLESAKN